MRRLLHNMSVAPQTVLTHKAGEGRTYGTGLVFTLPPGTHSTAPRRLLELLDGGPFGGAAPEEELRERVNAHARALPYPAVVLVTDRAVPKDAACADLLTIVTVLAKSSAHVYLRDKEPNLAAIRLDRRVVLIFPPDWSFQ